MTNLDIFIIIFAASFLVAPVAVLVLAYFDRGGPWQ